MSGGNSSVKATCPKYLLFLIACRHSLFADLMAAVGSKLN